MQPPLLVLSQPEFDDSVRQALRDLRRPVLLARNPLLRTRLVRDRAGDEEPSAATLEDARARRRSRPCASTRVTTSGGEPSSGPTCVRPAPRSGPPRRWGCRSAPTAGTSPRAWTGSWPGCGTRRSTASSTEHDRTASGLVTEQPPGAASPHRGGGCDEHADRQIAPWWSAQAWLGLLAAHVLADSYGQVTVIDRDELPETPTHRRGVPHGRHLHALAARGQQALEELFPGLTAELVACGAPAGDLLDDARLYLSGHRLRQAHSGLVLLCASRPLLELTCAPGSGPTPTCASIDRCDVVGLVTTPDGRRVTGVRVLRRADGSAEELLDADLVVDASGRGSRTPAWLEALGYPRPEQEQVQIGLGYATRTYRLPPDALDGDLAILDRGDTAASADRRHAAARRRPVDADAGRHPR